MLPKVLYGSAAFVIVNMFTLLGLFLSGVITVSDSAMTGFYGIISLGFVTSFAAIMTGKYLQNQDSAETKTTPV